MKKKSFHEEHERTVAQANARVASAQQPKNAVEEGATVREAVGIFQNSDDLQEAIRTLEGSAFPRQDISVMGRKQDLEKVFGVTAVDPVDAASAPDTPRRAPARPEEQTIGTSALIGGSAYVGAMAAALAAGAMALPATVAGAAVLGAAGGGSLAAILSRLLGNRYDKDIEAQIEQGGLLLWVRTPDPHREELAMTILRRHNARHVTLQELG